MPSAELRCRNKGLNVANITIAYTIITSIITLKAFTVKKKKN